MTIAFFAGPDVTMKSALALPQLKKILSPWEYDFDLIFFSFVSLTSLLTSALLMDRKKKNLLNIID